MNPRGLFIFWYLLYEYFSDVNMLLVGVFTLTFFILILLNNWSIRYHAQRAGELQTGLPPIEAGLAWSLEIFKKFGNRFRVFLF